jgi:zinc protease
MIRCLFLAVAFLLFTGSANAIEIEWVTSATGIEAWLVRDHKNPIINLKFSIKGGAGLDPIGKEGLAGMTAALLDEGAGPYDSKAFHEKLDDFSIELSFRSSLDGFSGHLRTLSENREQAFELMRLSLTSPHFAKVDVERIRGQIEAGLARKAEEPNYLANRALMPAMFGSDNYARESEGTLESIKRIAATDLKSFLSSQLTRKDLIIGVVGDITPGELAALIDKTFGWLPGTSKREPMNDVEASAAGGLKVIRRPMPQSVVLFAQPGIKRNDPDWYAAHVMNYILGGGGFVSRLMTEVREKRGLAYSVHSYLAPYDRSGLIYGNVATENARVAQSLAIIREEWRRMRDEMISEKELADAKTYLTGSFPLQFTNTEAIAGLLLSLQKDNLGIDFLSRRSGLIEAVTREDISRVAKRLLDPAKLSVVVVGNPEGL